MSTAEIAMLKSALRNSNHYLEYGAGGSTRMALETSAISTLTSVESDPEFVQGLMANDAAMQDAVQSGRLRFLIADIGKTKAWGQPVDCGKDYLWPNYALCPFVHGCRPDLVLLDGRFRIACALITAIELSKATILIHDYTIRSNYHILERFLEIEETCDTLVRCRRMKQFNNDVAKKLLRKYLYEPLDGRISRVNPFKKLIHDFCARRPEN